MSKEKSWVSVWGNAVSVAENRPERYAKDITVRYPIHMPFAGSALRLTFDNYCGTEPITLSKITVFYNGVFYPVSYEGKPSAIFYDTFSPATQPELWDEKIFRAIACGCASGSILTTYCSKGTVKQALRNAGFNLERLDGPPGKRHILRGIL